MGNLPIIFLVTRYTMLMTARYDFYIPDRPERCVAPQCKCLSPFTVEVEEKCLICSNVHNNTSFFRTKRISQSNCEFCRDAISTFLSSFSVLRPWTSALPFLIPPPPPPVPQHKLEDLTHHPRFSSNLVGSKVASWVWAGSRWSHAQGNPAKALQVLTPPLPWVPGWGGSGLENLPELSGMTSRLPLHHPLLCSHMAPVHRRQPWDEIPTREN